MRTLRAVVYAVVFAAGLLDAGSAQETSESKISDGPMERKKRNFNEQRSHRNEQHYEKSYFDPRLGVQKNVFLVQHVAGRSPKICSTPWA